MYSVHYRIIKNLVVNICIVKKVTKKLLSISLFVEIKFPRKLLKELSARFRPLVDGLELFKKGRLSGFTFAQQSENINF